MEKDAFLAKTTFYCIYYLWPVHAFIEDWDLIYNIYLSIYYLWILSQNLDRSIRTRLENSSTESASHSQNAQLSSTCIRDHYFIL